MAFRSCIVPVNAACYAARMVHEPHEPHEGLLCREEVFRVQGAIFEVNRVMGAGFLEAVYQERLALEFAVRDIPFVAQPALPLDYKGSRLRATYAPDFICFGTVLIELKALSALAAEHRARVLNYLKASRLRVGLLVKFRMRARAHRAIGPLTFVWFVWFVDPTLQS